MSQINKLSNTIFRVLHNKMLTTGPYSVSINRHQTTQNINIDQSKQKIQGEKEDIQQIR